MDVALHAMMEAWVVDGTGLQMATRMNQLIEGGHEMIEMKME